MNKPASIVEPLALVVSVALLAGLVLDAVGGAVLQWVPVAAVDLHWWGFALVVSGVPMLFVLALMSRRR